VIRRSRGVAVTGNTYRKECLPGVHHFFRNFRCDDHYVFWADLDSSIYAQRNLEYFKNSNFVPNELKARPIKDFIVLSSSPSPIISPSRWWSSSAAFILMRSPFDDLLGPS
jgi:hypothetical protein